MNKELLQKVRDRIADETVHYDQAHYWKTPEGASPFTLVNATKNGEFCGTPCCIAGHAVYEVGVEKVKQLRIDSIDLAAQKLLELSDTDASLMFFSKPIRVGRFGDRSPTRPETLAMLDHAIKTGEVRWEEK